jgi:hypothetical protein
MQPGGVERHFSDLFPSVPKSPSPIVQKGTLLEVTEGLPPVFLHEEETSKQVATATATNTTTSTTTAGSDKPNDLPPKPSDDVDAVATTIAVVAPPPSSGPPVMMTMSGGTNPATPAVARKLEFPSSKKLHSMVGSGGGGGGGPPPSAVAGSMAAATGGGGGGNGRGLPPMARNTTTALDAEALERRKRSKSAPPARPPPPPPPPPPRDTTAIPHKNAAAGSGGGGNGNGEINRTASKKKSTSTATRPAAVSTATLLKKDKGDDASSPTGSTTTTTTTTTTTIPFSRTTERAQSRKNGNVHNAKKETSPHLVPSSKTIPGPSEEELEQPIPPPTTSSKRDKLNLMRLAAAEKEEEELAAAATTAPPVTEPELLESADANVPVMDDAPPPPLVSETQRRLEEAYEKAEHEKTAALVRIKELEDKLLQTLDSAPVANSTSDMDWQHLLALAETEGPQAALEWAKQHGGSDGRGRDHTIGALSTPARPRGGGVGFAMSPFHGISGALDTPVRRRVSSRTLTPHPKRDVPPGSKASPNMEEVERQLIPRFREAAECVPFEYNSNLANFVVRRPYGYHTADQLFDYVSTKSYDEYSNWAHVTGLSTLEVAVTITADNSLMLLYDVAGVRYKTNPYSTEWKVVPNVDELDRPLGHVSYIDEHANELEYSLDEVLEEALLVREHYASTMISTALGFERRPPQPAVAAPGHPGDSPPELAKAPSKDVGVETDEKGMMTIPRNVQVDNDQTKSHEKVDPHPPADHASGSSDVLTIFIGMLFSSIFGLIYYIVIGLPLRILQTVFVLTATYAIINMVYFYLALDYNEWVLRENGGMVTSNDLLHFSNMRLGVM